MGCTFSVNYNGNIKSLLEMGRREALAFNGYLNGDTQSGVFLVNALGGTFSGNYEVFNNTIKFNLERKPFVIPCAVIESFLKSNIS